MPEGFVKSKFQMLVIISFKLKLFLCNYTLYLLVKQAFEGVTWSSIVDNIARFSSAVH